MLTVDQVIPEGPAHNILEPGDIVVFINKKLITTFVELEEILDDNVSEEIIVEIERGGVPHEVKIKVQDLHSITPSSFLEIGGGVVVVNFLRIFIDL
jgi:S1-C subfamily serine protease